MIFNNLKGKLSQKVATITKEHKFFSENVHALHALKYRRPFRLNRINDAQTKLKELQTGYQELESN